MKLFLMLLALNCFELRFNFELNQQISTNKSVHLTSNQRRNVESDFKKNDNEDEDSVELAEGSSSSKTTIPLIIPAPARITISLNAKKILKKRKKNFSKMAKSLIFLNGTDYDEIKDFLLTSNNNNDTYKFARSFTKSINAGKRFLKKKGLKIENFISKRCICKTFLVQGCLAKSFLTIQQI